MDARRVELLCRLLAFCAAVVLVALPLVSVAAWAFWSDAQLIAQAHASGISIRSDLATWQRLAGAALTLLPMAFVLAGIWCARRCFLLFLQGRYFDLQVISNLRRFAAWIAWSVLVSFVCKPAMSVVMTALNPPGQRQLSVGFSSQEIFILMFAGLVWVIAAVITHAKDLADEHAQFV